ncbi:MAG: TetR/AcrR family transcriptional regulator [Rhodoglobus sp.]|nr:TetR/AcrR family transcriptional regulator [Rhodoglobus sp.]
MDDAGAELELPRGVALAWGIAVNPQRGPKRELSIERIVEAAVEIADAEGLAAVSMSSVASKLGFTTMSLYRYVTAKDDLILLMQEYGTGLPPATIAESPDWREGLTRWSTETRAVYSAHPWLIDVPILGTPNTPNNLAWMDAALSVLRDSPLDMSERIGALLLVTGQTRWEATITRGYAISNQSLGMTPEERDRTDAQIIATLVTPEAFPHLFEVIRAGAFEAQDNPFQFGLERLLDGLEHYIAKRAAGAPPATVVPPEPALGYPGDPAVKAARQARRDAETRLREAQKREREAIKNAKEREKHQAQKERQLAEKERQRAAKG